MPELFAGQFDYIYFFYGLAFFLLGVICFTMGEGKSSRAPWPLLGLFGILHGSNEWLEMALFIYGKTRPLAIINLFILIISYLCLLEFARIGLYRLKGIIVERWAYVPLLLLLPLARHYGIEGWDIMARYSLGFTGAYFYCQDDLRTLPVRARGNRSLAFFSAMMSLYAVSTAVVTPTAPFVPASIINAESFYERFGVPIQLIRGIIALCAAMAIWSYSATLPEAKISLRAPFLRFVPTKRLIALTVIVLISAGWIFTKLPGLLYGNQNNRSTRARADSPLNRLTREITVLSRATVSLARASVVRQAVTEWKQEDAEKLKTALSSTKTDIARSNCVLMDREGKVIASAVNEVIEEDASKPHSGKPYFKDALAGENGYYFKLGTKYNERIYYVSYPVKNKDGNIAGVIMLVKKYPG